MRNADPPPFFTASAIDAIDALPAQIRRDVEIEVIREAHAAGRDLIEVDDVRRAERREWRCRARLPPLPDGCVE